MTARALNIARHVERAESESGCANDPGAKGLSSQRPLPDSLNPVAA